LPVDPAEADRVALAVKKLGLDYVVITSVTRDDLTDGGAGQFARVINAVYNVNRLIKIEVLIPDFLADCLSLKKVVEANPLVIAHNLETTRRLSKQLRPEADYARSLSVLSIIKDIKPDMITKSSLMLGLGESAADVLTSMQDLRAVECDIITFGQYLAPSKNHYPVKEFIKIEQFEKYKETALNLGFKSVLSAPLARSSYKAQEVFETANKAMVELRG
jgi:lipoic acid synthetase